MCALCMYVWIFFDTSGTLDAYELQIAYMYMLKFNCFINANTRKCTYGFSIKLTLANSKRQTIIMNGITTGNWYLPPVCISTFHCSMHMDPMVSKLMQWMKSNKWMVQMSIDFVTSLITEHRKLSMGLLWVVSCVLQCWQQLDCCVFGCWINIIIRTIDYFGYKRLCII